MRLLAPLAAAIALCAAGPAALAQKKYDPGATDTEIKIGQTIPYSGPASSYGQIGKAEAAYFKMINDQGGINGRKINFISLDDGYSPPKAVEGVRRLVEQDQVLLIFNMLGTPTNTAVHKYMNAKKVPHLFLATGASKWNDPKNFPWTMGWQPNYQTEGKIYAAHILKSKPNAKIAILFQNDDYGKDYLKGFKDGLGEAGRKLIVSELSYEVSDPTIDSQIVQLKGTGADAFMNITTPKFAAMAIRKAAEIGWKPLHVLNSVSASVGSVMQPAGLENGVGVVSTAYLMDPADPEYANEPGMVEWKAFMKKYLPDANLTDGNNVYGYTAAMGLVHVLKAAGDNLTRENIMKVASNIKDLQLPLAFKGVTVSTTPDDFAPYQSVQLIRFDGKSFKRFGEVMSGR
ncbi:MAG: ABC transporter substrate-binding protein [Burkholderiaceae bacterium]